MDISTLIKDLSRPEAFPESPGAVEVRQTHISAVFLTDRLAYKVKKPVALGFLDFSTLEKRLHLCREEVRLNRRLAPDVYLGAVPVTRTPQGTRFEGEGEGVEWAVKMRRLPDEATLEARLQRGEVVEGIVSALARKLAGFHAAAERGPHVSAFGRFAAVAGNARDNFEQSSHQPGRTVSPAVFARLRELTERRLEELRSLIESRASRGVPRDTHGDLHLDHVYLFPDRSPPDDLVIIDCIEFNERYRYADPVADMAFLAMELAFHGRRDLARAFATAYFSASGDDEGRALLPFYSAYRATIRAKVEGLKAAEAEVPADQREAAAESAGAHWLLALGELEEPARRPCLVLVAGLPGSGKSTLARRLGDDHGFEVIRSDVVRKELSRAEKDIYSPEWNDRTYMECQRRAEALLREGRRVIVDANFREGRRRSAFFDLARRSGVPGLMLVCRADPETVRRRLERRVGDVSDADWSVYAKVSREWEEPGADTRPSVHEVNSDSSPDETLARAVTILRRDDLAG